MPEGPRHEAAGHQRERGGLGPFGRGEVEQQEVGDARLRVPADLGERGGQPRPLRLDAGDVRLHLGRVLERGGDDGRGDGPDRPRRPVDREPGDRLAGADREPDPQPGHRVRLRCGAHRRPRSGTGCGAGSPTRGRTRCRPRRRRRRVPGDRPPRRRPRCPRAAARSRPRAPAGRSGCSGCTPRRGSPRGRRHGPPRRPSPSPRPSSGAGRRSRGRRAAPRGCGTSRRSGSR